MNRAEKEIIEKYEDLKDAILVFEAIKRQKTKGINWENLKNKLKK